MKEPTDAETLRALQFALAPLQIEDRPTAAWIETPTACYLVGQTKQDAQAEHEADLRYESIMADESEHGPRCNSRHDSTCNLAPRTTETQQQNQQIEKLPKSIAKL